MIRKQLDNISVNSYSGTNNELIVPSRVQTSYAKQETYELSYSNFMVTTELPKAYTNDLYVGGTYPVTLEDNSYLYTAYMNIVSWCNTRNGVKLTMQYNYGLTVEEVEHTFKCAATEIATSYDLISGDDEVGVTHFLYDGTSVPAADISFGTLNYHNITVGEPTANDITLTPKTSFPEISTGEFVDTLTATYKGMTATVNVVLTITKEQTGPSFTYDGSDKNNPIPVDVELNHLDDACIHTHLSAPEGIQYDWETIGTWTPSIDEELYSNTNDFPITGMLTGDGEFYIVTDIDGDAKKIWTDGPTAAGTYLKSYSMTFVYNKAYSQIYDETTGDPIDDPVAQALDGTVVTFWVEYNVTGAYAPWHGAYPESENP